MHYMYEARPAFAHSAKPMSPALTRERLILPSIGDEYRHCTVSATDKCLRYLMPPPFHAMQPPLIEATNSHFSTESSLRGMSQQTPRSLTIAAKPQMPQRGRHAVLSSESKPGSVHLMSVIE